MKHEDPKWPAWVGAAVDGAVTSLTRCGRKPKRRRVKHLMTRCFEKFRQADKRERGRHDRWKRVLLVRDMLAVIGQAAAIRALYRTPRDHAGQEPPP